MSGIVYLVQPAELVGTNRYKIGCSSKNDLSRCKNGYKTGTRYIHIMECTEPFNIESQIKRVFNEKFKLIAGKEYFEGNETDMKTTFFEIVTNYKPSEKPNILNKPTDSELDSNNTVLEPSNTDKIINSVCNKQFTDKNLKAHRVEPKSKPNMQSDPITCKNCSKNYGSYTSFRRHIEYGRCKGIPSDTPSTNKEPENPVQVTCPKCNKTFHNIYNLKRHSKSGCKANIVKDLLSEQEGQSMVKKLLEIILTNIPGNITNNNQCIINNNP
jgi:hypothetical protein